VAGVDAEDIVLLDLLTAFPSLLTVFELNPEEDPNITFGFQEYLVELFSNQRSGKVNAKRNKEPS